MKDLKSFEIEKLSDICSTMIFGQSKHKKQIVIEKLIQNNKEKYERCVILNPGFVYKSFNKVINDENILSDEQSIQSFINDVVYSKNNARTLIILMDFDLYDSISQSSAYWRLIYMYKEFNVTIVSTFSKIENISFEKRNASTYVMLLNELNPFFIGLFFNNVKYMRNIDMTPNELIKMCESNNSALVIDSDKQLSVLNYGNVDELECDHKNKTLKHDRELNNRNRLSKEDDVIVKKMMKNIFDKLFLIEKNINNTREKESERTFKNKIQTITEIDYFSMPIGTSILIDEIDMTFPKTNIFVDLLKNVKNLYREIYVKIDDLKEQDYVNMENVKYIKKKQMNNILNAIMQKQKKIVEDLNQSSINHAVLIVICNSEYLDEECFEKLVKQMKTLCIDLIISSECVRCKEEKKYFDVILNHVGSKDNMQQTDELSHDHRNVCFFKDRMCFENEKEYDEYVQYLNQFKTEHPKWLCIFKKKLQHSLCNYSTK